jgi:hypothetical protein
MQTMRSWWRDAYLEGGVSDVRHEHTPIFPRVLFKVVVDQWPPEDDKQVNVTRQRLGNA